MQTKIIPIGTSKGIRIPKYLLDKYGLEGEVDVEDTGHGILIKPAHTARSGWADAFEKTAAVKNDKMLTMPESDWDKNEWEW